MNQFMNNDYKSLADYLFSLTGNEFAILSSVIGYLISQNLQIDQANSIGNFLEAVGQFILSKAAQDQVVMNHKQNRR